MRYQQFFPHFLFTKKNSIRFLCSNRLSEGHLIDWSYLLENNITSLSSMRDGSDICYNGLLCSSGSFVRQTFEDQTRKQNYFLFFSINITGYRLLDRSIRVFFIDGLVFGLQSDSRMVHRGLV